MVRAILGAHVRVVAEALVPRARHGPSRGHARAHGLERRPATAGWIVRAAMEVQPDSLALAVLRAPLEGLPFREVPAPSERSAQRGPDLSRAVLDPVLDQPDDGTAPVVPSPLSGEHVDPGSGHVRPARRLREGGRDPSVPPLEYVLLAVVELDGVRKRLPQPAPHVPARPLVRPAGISEAAAAGARPGRRERVAYWLFPGERGTGCQTLAGDPRTILTPAVGRRHTA